MNMKFDFKKNLSKIIIFIPLAIGLFLIFNYSSNKKVNDKQAEIKNEIFLSKLDELSDENDRILELYNVTDGITEYEYKTYEKRELKNLKDWKEDNNISDEQYNDLKDFVELNAKAYRDVYFNQPTRNNY